MVDKTKKLIELIGVTIQLPFDKKLPTKLLKSIVEFRAHENLEKSRMKKKQGSSAKRK